MTLYVRPTGLVEGVYQDPLTKLVNILGPMAIARASHVEPVPAGNGDWYAQLDTRFGGARQEFPSRGLALEWEVNQIEEVFNQ